MFRIKATNVLMLCIGEAVVYDDASDWFFFFFWVFLLGGGVTLHHLPLLPLQWSTIIYYILDAWLCLYVKLYFEI